MEHHHHHHHQAKIWTFTSPCLRHWTAHVVCVWTHTLYKELSLLNVHFKTKRDGDGSEFERGAGSCLIPLSLTVCRRRDRQAPGLPTHVCRLSPAAVCPAMIPVNLGAWLQSDLSVVRWFVPVFSLAVVERCRGSGPVSIRLRGVTLRRRRALALGGDRQGACALPSHFCPETCLSLLFVCFLSEQQEMCHSSHYKC